MKEKKITGKQRMIFEGFEKILKMSSVTKLNLEKRMMIAIKITVSHFTNNHLVDTRHVVTLIATTERRMFIIMPYF